MAATQQYGGNRQSLTLVTIPWTSDSIGNYTETIPLVCGVLLRIITDPGATAPTDNYDITLTDAWGFDILSARGADRDTANTESFTPLNAATDGTTTTAMPVAIFGTLSLSIANAGNAKNGTIYLILG